MGSPSTPHGQDAQAQRDADSRAAWQKLLSNPGEFKKLIAALNAREHYDRAQKAKRRACADRLNLFHYYAEVTECPDNTNHRQWADCRLYASPATPPTREDSRGCIGSIWLHNPSTAFKLTLPHAWGRIVLNQPEDPRSNTINYVIHILQSAIVKARTNGYTPPAESSHFNLEELAYLDSDSITGLWWNLSTAEIQPFTHQARFRDTAPFPTFPAFKFIWIAWGDLERCSIRDELFKPTVMHAAEAALNANVDLVFVTMHVQLKPPYYSVPIHRWSSKQKRWFLYSPNGIEAGHKAEKPLWDFDRCPPLHPQQLRQRDADKIEPFENALVAAIADTLL